MTELEIILGVVSLLSLRELGRYLEVRKRKEGDPFPFI